MTDRVRLRLNGRMPERFIGRALESGVEFAAIERTGPRELLLSVTPENAVRVRALAESYSLGCVEEGREGFRTYLIEALRRNTLFVGLILCCALVALFGSRVWSVDVICADGSPDAALEQTLLGALSERGCGIGASRRGIDPDSLSAVLMGRFPRLTYAGVRLSGVRLTLEYGTADEAPGIYDIGEVCDLVAARDAVVLSVQPLSGTACVEPGETVTAGQMLIRGEERDHEGVHAIGARGSVIGRVWFTAESEMPDHRETIRRTGRRDEERALALPFFGRVLKESVSFGQCEEEVSSVPVGGLFIPVTVRRRTLWETEAVSSPLTEGDMESLREEAVLLARSQLPRGAEESRVWTDITSSDGRVTVRAVIEAAVNIACVRTGKQ